MDYKQENTKTLHYAFFFKRALRSTYRNKLPLKEENVLHLTVRALVGWELE
jgi:hypothetical protein